MCLKLSEKIDGGIKCLLCPHFCLLKSGQSGKCLVRKANTEEIYLSTYGQLTHIIVEPIEKKPFRYFLSGTKTLSIGSFSCNLSCLFCENFKYSQRNKIKETKYFSPLELVSLVIEKNCSSICMTYNEPIISYEYLLDIAKEYHKSDLKFLLKTNAYINEKPWNNICKVVDAVNIDWKGTTDNYQKICHSNKEYDTSKKIIYERIKSAYKSGIHVEISIPVFNSELSSNKGFYGFAKFVSSLDKNIPCHLLKIFPTNKCEDLFTTSEKNIKDSYRIFSHFLNRVYSN